MRFESADGRCHICLATGKKLTKDHVPPSGVLGGRKPATVRQPLQIQRMDRHPALPDLVSSRTGVYFRTVCDDCHRPISENDAALQAFVSRVRAALRNYAATSALANLFDSFGIVADAAAVLEAVLAHNLTSRLCTQDSVFESNIRSIVRDKDFSAGREMFFYVWRYMAAETFIMHDFVAPTLRKIPIGSVISFSPETFFLAGQQIDGVKGINVESCLVAPPARLSYDLHADESGAWPRTVPIFGGASMAEFIVAEEE